MADEYIESIILEVNGAEITDFDEVTENEYEVRSVVNLMNKTGFSKKTPRYGAKVKYVIPKNDTPFDFEGVEDGTLTIVQSDARRITYTGVFTAKIGEDSYADKAAMQTIEFGATGRTTT
jgi:hypothetical protein